MCVPTKHGIAADDHFLHWQPEDGVIDAVSLHWAKEYDWTRRVPLQDAKAKRIGLRPARIFRNIVTQKICHERDFRKILLVDVLADIRCGVELRLWPCRTDGVAGEKVVRVMMADKHGGDREICFRFGPRYDGLSVLDQGGWIDKHSALLANYQSRQSADTISRGWMDVNLEWRRRCSHVLWCKARCRHISEVLSKTSSRIEMVGYLHAHER